MEQLTVNFRHGLRESAQRLGLTDFWRWWIGQLRAMLPAGVRHALQRWGLRPVLVVRPDAAVILEPQLQAGSLAYVETARVSVHGDAGEVLQAGRAAMDALARRTRGAGPGAARVVIALAPGQVLRKQLTYPAAVEGNLAQVLGYDLDRHTPFKTEDVYYDAAIVGRDSARGVIRLELVVALRSLVDQLRRQAGSWGAAVAAVVPEVPRLDAPAGGAARRLNLLPEGERVEHSSWRSLRTWIPATLVLALIVAALTIPLVQKRDAAIALLHVTEQARIHAGASDALRQQLEQSVDDYNFVLSRKYAFPSTLQLLDDVTRLLPDDTWLTQLELKSTPRGKEPHRDILLRGESANAGRLVSLLEDSHLFEQAAPRSPTTKIQPGPGEIFDLGAEVKPLPMPASVQLASAAPPAGPAHSGAGRSGAGLGATPAPAGGVKAASPGAAAAASAPAAASGSGTAAVSGTAAAPVAAGPSAAGPGPVGVAGTPAAARPTGSAVPAPSASAHAAASAGPVPARTGVGNAPAVAARTGQDASAGQFGPVADDGRVPGQGR